MHWLVVKCELDIYISAIIDNLDYLFKIDYPLHPIQGKM